MTRVDRHVERFAAVLERVGFGLMAAASIGLGCVLLGYLAGWWILAVALVVAARVWVAVRRAGQMVDAWTRVDRQRTTLIRGPVTPRVHTERKMRNGRPVVNEHGEEVR